MGRFGDWINRQRHNRGFGIQSPSSFFFITQVLNERLPYYAYPALEYIASQEGYSAKRLKELFRIANNHKPVNCIAVGSPAAACAMIAAKPTATAHCITETMPVKEVSEMLKSTGCNVTTGNIMERLAVILDAQKEIGMLYIGNTPHRAELLETALRYTNDNSLIVIDGIHNDSTTAAWWQTVIEKPETIITYDLYSKGLLFFNKERIKQHYTLKR